MSKVGRKKTVFHVSDMYLTESVAIQIGMHYTKDRVESDTSTIDSIYLYESTIIAQDETGFGKWKLALGVKR